MKRRTFLKTTAAVPIILGAPSIVKAAGKGSQKLRIGVITPGSHFWTKSMTRFGESLSKKTNGEFEVTVFPSGQLGNEATMIQQIQSGALDMGFLTVAEFSNRIDDMASLFAPHLVGNVNEGSKILTGPTATNMLNQFETLGMKGFGFGLGGMRHLISRDPVSTAADLGGKKYRITPFAPLRDFFNLMDVAPTPIPLPGLFDALANGQVDGADIDLELAWKLKLYDKAPNLNITNHMMFPVVSVMSGRVWSKYNAEEQSIIQQTVTEELNWLFGQYSKFDPQWQSDLKGTGMSIQKSTDKSFFGPVLDQWAEIWEPKAPSIAALRAEAYSI